MANTTGKKILYDNKPVQVDSAVRDGTGKIISSTYATKSEVPTALSQLSADSTHRLVTDTEKSTWNGKQGKIGAGAGKFVMATGTAGTVGLYSLEVTGSGNAVTNVAVDQTNSKITVTKGTTFPTSNTDTKVTQAYSTTSNSYPLLMSATAGVSSTDSRGDTTAILNNQIYANPSNGSINAKSVIASNGFFTDHGNTGGAIYSSYTSSNGLVGYISLAYHGSTERFASINTICTDSASTSFKFTTETNSDLFKIEGDGKVTLSLSGTISDNDTYAVTGGTVYAALQNYALSSSIPVASSSTPANLGTAAVGTSTAYARADHVHKKPTLSDLGAAASSHTHGNIANDGSISSNKGTIVITNSSTGKLEASGTALSTLAPKASPALTGTPTAPTAAAGTNTTQIATTAFVNAAFQANDAMVFKGTIGTGGTVTALPATHYQGWTYKVITAGQYAGQTCEVGDMIICVTDGTTATDSHWTIVQSNTDGVVVGPSSSTDGNFPLFDGSTGKLIQNSTYSPSSFATSGHNHDSTYLKLSGGTMTGNLIRKNSSANAASPPSSGTVFIPIGYTNDTGNRTVGWTEWSINSTHQAMSLGIRPYNGTTAKTLGYMGLKAPVGSTDAVWGYTSYRATPTDANEILTLGNGVIKVTVGTTNYTPSSGVITLPAYPSVPSAYTSNPAALGTASAGSSGNWARGDHVHPKPSASDIGAAAASHAHGNIASGGTLGTASMVVVTDANKKITTDSKITITELEYLDGVSSSIQTQIDGKIKRGSYERIEGTTSAHKNLNSYILSGFYNVKGVYTDNCPISGEHDWYLMVMPWNSGSWCAQVCVMGNYETANDNCMWIRSTKGSDASQWTAWKRMALSSEVPTTYVSTVNGSSGVITGIATTAQLTDGSVTKVGTGTVGGTLKIMYLNSGTPTNGTQLYSKNININGTNQAVIRSTNADVGTVYAPTSAGTSGQLVKSNGSGAPGWVNQSALTPGVSIAADTSSTATGISLAANTKYKITVGASTFLFTTQANQTLAAAAGSNIGSVGTPSVTASTSGTTTTFTFNYLKGAKGDKGDTGTTPTIAAAAGTNIGTVGTPSVTASTSGTTTTFTFNYLKGAKGDKGDTGTTPTIAAAAGTNIGSVGTPTVTASTSGTTTTFTFNYLKGAKGDTGPAGSYTWSSGGTGNIVTGVAESSGTITVTKGYNLVTAWSSTTADTNIASEKLVKTSLGDGSVTKVGTASVGATLKIMYLNAGVPTNGTQLYNKNFYVNNTTYTVIRSTNSNLATIYAPTTGGTAGQILYANGATSTPTWTNQSNITAGAATTLSVSSTTSIATTNGVQLISTTILSQAGYWLIETYSSGNYGFQRATSVADPACVAVRTKNNSTTWGSWTYSYAVWKA